MRNLIFIFFFLKLTTAIYAQTSDTSSFIQDHPSRFLSAEASYIGDIAVNTLGGLNTGTVYLGLANLGIQMSTEQLGLWPKGELYFNGAASHGESPSEMLTGDFQVASNIDAGGDYMYIQELWYQQGFGKFEFVIGLQDLNANFANSEHSGHFINSSFGIAPVIADNVPASIFPLTTLGFSGKFHFLKNSTLKLAVFDGNPTSFAFNKYNTQWQVKNSDGLLFISELQLNKNIQDLPGSYKFGYYYHTGLQHQDPETQVVTSVFEKNYGYYFIADQSIWKNTKRSLSLFSQFAYSPPDINEHHLYLGFGLNLDGIFLKSGKDALGLAVAFAGFNQEKNHQHEIVYEFYYHIALGDQIYFRPDIQYILNPEGSDQILDNALLMLLRFGININ